MKCEVPNRARPGWRITYAVRCDDGWSLELEQGGEHVLATLELEDRGGRPGQPPDWRVHSVCCDVAAAREWLEEHAASELSGAVQS